MLAQQIVDRVRALAFIPNTTEFSDANLLAEINVAQVEDVVPAIVKVNGEYFTEILDVTPDTTGYARLPAAALASTARLITWVDPYGRESKPLNHIEIADISTIQATGYAVGQPYAFTLLPDGIQLGGSLENGALRVRYSRLPSDLILPTSTGSATVWTLTAPVQDAATVKWVSTPTPIGGGSGSPTAPLDVTDALSPSRLIVGSCATELIRFSEFVVISPIDGSVGDALAARVLAGSYCTAAGTTYVPQYPKEWHNLLVYFGAALMAYRRKDYSLQASLRQSAQMLQDKLTDVSQPRTKQNPKVISAWRGHGGRGNGRF